MVPKMDLISLVTTTIIITVLINILIHIFRFWKFRKTINKIPGPKYSPVLGISRHMSKLPLQDRLNYLMKMNYQFKEGIVKFWIGPIATVFIRKPKQLEVILSNTTQITKSVTYQLIRVWLGEGLVTSTGSKWFHDRKMITPSFHFGVLEDFVEVMHEKAQILNECLTQFLKKNPDKPIDIFEYSVRCTLDVICETAMGISLDCQRKTDSAYGQALLNFSILTIKRIMKPWLNWNWLYYRTAEGKELLKAVNTMHQYSMKVIQKKQEERKVKRNESSIAEYEDETGKRKRKALLDLLLDAAENENKSLTETELREHVDTFMFAGHDTTAAAISWALFLLGHNPDIQDKIAEELNEVLENSDEILTHKDLAKLKYLELVMKESLRMYPSVPQVSRNITEDIEIDGYIIPKDTVLVISIFLLHRDPDVWPNPNKFDPDRFLPENSKGRHPYAFIPFSAGSRNCIGQKFAMIEFKMILASILKKWKVKSACSLQDMKMVSAFILRPHNGIPMYFTPR